MDKKRLIVIGIKRKGEKKFTLTEAKDSTQHIENLTEPNPAHFNNIPLSDFASAERMID